MDSTGAFAMPLERGRRRLPLVAVALAMIGTVAVLVVGAVWVIGGDDEPSEPEKVVLFLDTGITDEQLAALVTKIDGHPDVASVYYLDEDESRAEVEQFELSSPLSAWLEDNPDGLPTSFRVAPDAPGPDSVQSLIAAFADEPGVIRATTSDDVEPHDPWK